MSTNELGYMYYSESRMLYYDLLAGDEQGFTRKLKNLMKDSPLAVPYIIASIMNMVTAAALKLHILELLESIATGHEEVVS